MTQLEKVQYTAKDHSDDGRLDVKVSSPGTPGTGTNPEVNHSPAAKLVFPRRRMIKSAVSSSPTRHSFLTGSAAAVAFGLVLLSGPSYAQTVSAADASVISPHPARLGAATEDTAIRPFRIRVPDAALKRIHGQPSITTSIGSRLNASIPSRPSGLPDWPALTPMSGISATQWSKACASSKYRHDTDEKE